MSNQLIPHFLFCSEALFFKNFPLSACNHFSSLMFSRLFFFSQTKGQQTKRQFHFFDPRDNGEFVNKDFFFPLRYKNFWTATGVLSQRQWSCLISQMSLACFHFKYRKWNLKKWAGRTWKTLRNKNIKWALPVGLEWCKMCNYEAQHKLSDRLEGQKSAKVLSIAGKEVMWPFFWPNWLLWKDFSN